MSIDPDLEGWWQLDTELSEGSESYLDPWHYLFRNGIHKEIVPDIVDDGTLRCAYEVDLGTRPRRLKITLDYNGPDGPPDPNAKVLRAVYEIDGDKLRLTYGEDGDFPEKLSDEFPFTIQTLIRYEGPEPQSRQPSGTPPLIHEQLGQLKWNDNVHWYEGIIELSGKSVEIHLRPASADDTAAVVKRACTIINNDAKYLELVQRYAVQGLLDIKNDSWLDAHQRPITQQQFVQTMTLESVSVRADGQVEFWHDDGGLFHGHSIQVVIDADDRCVLTDIPG